MRIGIDLRMCSHTGSGFARLAKNIVRSLALYGDFASWVLLVHSPEVLEIKSNNLEICKISTPLFDINEGAELQKIAANQNLDLLHLPFSLYPEGLDVPVLLSLSDLSPLTHPETIGERYLEHYLGGITRASGATLVHVLSEEIRVELVKRDLVSPLQISVVTPISPFESDLYFDNSQTQNAAPITTPYVLSVGTISPRKNYCKALEHLEYVWKNGESQFDWVIAGWDHGGDPQFDSAVARSKFKANVKLLRNISDRDLKLLYSRALFLLNCSVHEGFYFPALEALSFSCPVVSPLVPSLSAAGITESEIHSPAELEKCGDFITTLLSSGLRDETKDLKEKVSSFYNELPKTRFVSLYRDALSRLNLG